MRNRFCVTNTLGSRTPATGLRAIRLSLVARDSSGPEVTPAVSLFQVFGYNLLVVSCILVLRVLFVIFRQQR